MAFLGLNNKLKLRLVNWGLSPAVIRAFLDLLEGTFKSIDPADIPASRLLGINRNFVVTDPGDADKNYVFFLRFARNDDDFWVYDITCTGVTKDNKVFWTPPSEFSH